MVIYEARVAYTAVRKQIRKGALGTPALIVEYMAGAFDDAPLQESMFVVGLDRKGKPIFRSRVSLGILTAALCHPREFYRPAILAGADSVVAVHNHPSGDPSPSAQDMALTRNLREAGKVMGIRFEDHVIIGQKEECPAGVGFVSLRAMGHV